ncbi:MAG TPA: putative toxin-antitoxin system toxin component, PIN family [Bdellovibrionota bacterium]|nr:putative toxin-antitoxin system toxin component, PIN family [Bdellovibrionota bacterium]
MKLVIDTNVLIAAFATHGLCESVFEIAVSQHEMFISDHILGEIRKALQLKLKVPEKFIEETIDYLKEYCLLETPLEIPQDVCRDKNDLHILGLATKVEADFIITGDQDLLTLEKFGQTRIVSPRNFWEELQYEKG